MPDVMSAEKRSALMARIGPKNTEPELSVRSQLWHLGFRFRLHGANLPGKPDIILTRWKAVIFVHGCFWHRHQGCALFKLPATRAEFWDSKLRRNRDRDAATYRSLGELGWRIAVVWECALRAADADVGKPLGRWLKRGGGDLELFAVEGAVAMREALRQIPSLDKPVSAR